MDPVRRLLSHLSLALYEQVSLSVAHSLMRYAETSNSQWQSKEPWLFRKESVPIITEFLKYRHRLMPYLYSMNVRSAKEYEPIVQPMYWSWPERDEAYSVPNQYYFGSELIVAPI